MDKIKSDMIWALSAAREVCGGELCAGKTGLVQTDGAKVAVALVALKIFEEMRKS